MISHTAKFVVPVVLRQCSVLRHLQKRTTFIVKHAKRLPKTAPNDYQRPPNEKQEYQQYEIVDNLTAKELPPIKIILLKTVDGVGRHGDVVTVPHDDAHNRLFPMGAAVYATEYDLKLLDKRRKSGLYDKLEPSDMVSFEEKTFARKLNNTIVKITMSFDVDWTLEKWHIAANLLRSGFVVPEQSVIMPAQPLNGPNKNLEGQLFTFYVKTTPHCVVPVLGCLEQTSSRGQQLITDQRAGVQSATAAAAPRAEPVYFSLEPISTVDKEVLLLMSNRRQEKP